MPTERFLRLSENKKQVIREAAKKELSRVPYEKVSINQIIQNADISRGSFYTYFEDKEDVVRWIFEDSCNEAIDRGDGMLEITRNILSNQENLKIFGLEGMPDPTQVGGEGSLGRWVYDRIDKTLLYKEDIQNFLPILTMGASVLLLQIRQYYEYPLYRQEARKGFYRGMALLRRGAYRRSV